VPSLPPCHRGKAITEARLIRQQKKNEEKGTPVPAGEAATCTGPYWGTLLASSPAAKTQLFASARAIGVRWTAGGADGAAIEVPYVSVMSAAG